MDSLFLFGRLQLFLREQKLFQEVASGNLPSVKAAARADPTILDLKTEKGCTLLHMAAYFSRLNLIQWLMSNEGRAAGFRSILARSKDEDSTALDITITINNTDMQCFKAIVYGCKVENGEREQMLNAQGRDGFTVLHIAVLEGKVAVIQWLLSDKKGGGREAGFHNLFATEKSQGLTAFLQACGKNRFDSLTAIVEGCKEANGELKQMLNSTSTDGTNALHYASFFGYLPTINWLLSKGRELGFTGILAKDGRKMTAFHLAAAAGHLEACKAIAEGCKAENGEREKMLNATAMEGFTALHYAVAAKRTSVVNWLLSDKPGGGRTFGFNYVLARSEKDGKTALHFAAQEGELEICKAIVNGCKVENGKKRKIINVIDKTGSSALHWAVLSGRRDMVSWLLSRDAHGERVHEWTSEAITAVTNESLSVLHLAAQFGSLDTLRAVLSGCTAEEKLKLFAIVDNRGWTVLHQATRYGRPTILRELLLRHDETKMIVNHRDYRGMTALHRAVLDGGLDKESREEWTRITPKLPRAPREDVIEALLTYEYEDDEEEDEKGGQAASSTSTIQQQQGQHPRLLVNLGVKRE